MAKKILKPAANKEGNTTTTTNKNKAGVSGAGVKKSTKKPAAKKEAPKKEDNKKRSDLKTKPVVYVDRSQIHIEEGFNIRENISAEESKEMGKSIAKYGIIQPLTAHWDEKLQKYVLDNGHRRISGVDWLAENKPNKKVTIPVMELPKNTSELDRNVFLMLFNSGKNLTIMEQANLFKRLQTQFNLSKQAVANRVGKTAAHVGQALMLLDAPKELQDYVDNGTITASELIKQLQRDKNSGEITLKRVKKAVEAKAAKNAENGKGDKPTKVSGKDFKTDNQPKVETEKTSSADTTTNTESTEDNSGAGVPKKLTLKTEVVETAIEKMKKFGDADSEVAAKVLEAVLAYGTGAVTDTVFLSTLVDGLLK